DGTVGQVHHPGTNAAAVAGEVVLDRAAHDGEHAPLALGIRLNLDAAALSSSDVMDEDGVDQRHVPRPRPREVGDAASWAGGPVAGDDAVADHQVGVAHPDAAPIRPGHLPVANGQTLEGDLDGTGGVAEYVEHAVELLAVDDGGIRPCPLEQGAIAD